MPYIKFYSCVVFCFFILQGMAVAAPAKELPRSVVGGLNIRNDQTELIGNRKPFNPVSCRNSKDQYVYWTSGKVVLRIKFRQDILIFPYDERLDGILSPTDRRSKISGDREGPEGCLENPFRTLIAEYDPEFQGIGRGVYITAIPYLQRFDRDLFRNYFPARKGWQEIQRGTAAGHGVLVPVNADYSVKREDSIEASYHHLEYLNLCEVAYSQIRKCKREKARDDDRFAIYQIPTAEFSSGLYQMRDLYIVSEPPIATGESLFSNVELTSTYLLFGEILIQRNFVIERTYLSNVPKYYVDFLSYLISLRLRS